MYSRGIQLVCEPDVFSSREYHGDSEPGIRRKREKWKATTMRWPGSRPCGLLQESMKGNRTVLAERGKGHNISLLTAEKVQVRSRFVTTVTPIDGRTAQSGSPKVTGTGTNELCPAPFPDSDCFMKQLPLQVSIGLVLESLGTRYKGPNEDKYWSPIYSKFNNCAPRCVADAIAGLHNIDSRCGLQHPYPVGYTATKTYKGVRFQQTIEEGPDGPIFVVGEVNKDSYSADSPTKAWCLALANSQLNSTTRVHGRKHFGFDCHLVLGFLLQMDKKGVAKDNNFIVQSEESLTSGKGDVEKKLHFHGDGDLEGNDHMASSNSKVGPPLKMNNRMSSTEQSKRLIQNSSPSLGAYGHSIHLRSVHVKEMHNQRGHVLLCQDTNHPATKGFLQEMMANLYNEDSAVTGTLSNKEFAMSRRKMSKHNASSINDTALKHGVSDVASSLDSILKRMDEVAQIGRYVGTVDKSSVNREGLEKTVNGNTPDRGFLKQKSSMRQLFSPPVHRSRTFLEESASKDTKKPGQTRSLANLLEDWNKTGRSQRPLSGKPQVGGEGNIQSLLSPPTMVDRVTTTWEEKNESLTETSSLIGFLDSTYEDMERRVKAWASGKEGRSSVLKEIQQLVVDNRADQALQILKKLHSDGNQLDDAVYSVFFPFTFDDWQKQAVKQVQENSVLICAPGGAGKFVVAARCLYKAFVQGERCVFVTPYESLAKDRQHQLQVLFGNKNVGSLLTKAENGWSPFPITVMTIETLIKGLREGRFNERSSDSNFFEGLSLAVMDRFHTLGDASCGSLWEEAVILLNQKVKLVALSLPVNAPRDISSWISCTHRPCEVVTCDSEPVLKSHYYCNTSGLHLLGISDQKELLSSSQIHKDEYSSTVGTDSVTDLQLSIRVLLRSLEPERFLPLAISFSSIQDCIAAMQEANDVIQGGHISPKEVVRIEERLENFFKQNADIEHSVSKDDRLSLLRGFSMYHDGQLPLWTEFVQGLVRDNLVKIVFGTATMLSRTRIFVRTVALCLIPRKTESGNYSQPTSDLMQLLANARHRDLDSWENVIFVGSDHIQEIEGLVMASGSTLSICSHFEPSYSLLLNLLSKHTLLKVRQLVESNYGDHLAKKLHKEDLGAKLVGQHGYFFPLMLLSVLISSQELKDLERKISDVKERKEELEAKLFQKLKNINSTKLQDATIFTHVDVRVDRSGPPWTDNILPGLLCAVLPGPSELLYVILCADNNFRLLPVWAFDHVYSEDQLLDSVYESATGHTLQAPRLPIKEKWKRSPGDHLEYVSEGTAESAAVVDVLLQYRVKLRVTEEERDYREEIGSCNGLLSNLCEKQEMLSSKQTPATTIWTRSEKLIEVLEKADAMEFTPSKTPSATLKPLGVLISKLHCVENELWYAMALSSSIVKPLTAPELAAICSALLLTIQPIDPESSGSKSTILNKANIAHDTPKRLRAALEKLENLQKKVELLQGSDRPPLRLDGRAVTAVHSFCREMVGQDPVNDLTYWMALHLQQTIKLLHIVDDVWGRSTHVLSALKGTSGLHNLARRATLLLEKV